MVDTVKFSEFIDAGNPGPTQNPVGLSSGTNAIFTTWLPIMEPGPTGDRPAIAANMYYRLRFNTSLDVLAYEYYSPVTAAWIQLQSSGDLDQIYAALASHVTGFGASLIGLEDQPNVTDKTVQDLANASIVASTDNATLNNGVFLSNLATGILASTVATGALASRILTGTTNQINVANGNGSADPTFSLSSTLNLPGTFNIQSSTAIDAIINDDTFATASATNVPTTLSVKNYITSTLAPLEFDTNSGSAIASSGIINFTGTGTGLTFSGATNVVTLGGTLNLASGGTNASLTASNGGIFYSTGSAGAILAGTATAGQILRSGSSAAPSWSTATFASTYSVSTILYASSANTVTGLATANNGVLITSASGVPSLLAAGTTGQFLRATTGSPASWSTLTFNTQSGNIGVTGATVTYTTLASNGTLSFSGSGSTITLNTTNGFACVAIGNLSGVGLNTGGSNAFFGASSGTAVTNGSSNTLIGAAAGQAVITGNNNTFVGAAAGSGTTASDNTAIGNGALFANILGASNCAGGYRSYARLTADNCTAFGWRSGEGFTSGAGNTCLGKAAGSGRNGIDTLTGSNNILIGNAAIEAGGFFRAAESSNILIGSFGTLSENNAIHIGADGSGAGQQNKCFIAGTYNVDPGTAWRPRVTNSSGQQGTATDTTGAGTPLLGANCPAVTVAAPYTWIKFTSSDGSTVYVPAWK